MASLIAKAAAAVYKASRGTLSAYVVGSPHEYGQPPVAAAGDITVAITPQRMREVVMKTPTAAAAMNAVLDYVAGVRIDVRNADPSKPADDARCRFVRQLLRNPNPQDTERRFRTKVIRDLFTLGWAGVELEPGKQSGRPANLWALDAARLRVDYDEHGKVLGYNMLDIYGLPITAADGAHAWTPEQVVWYELNPVSSSLYPTSRIQQLFTLAVLEDLMLAFIGGRFTESNVPYGVMDLGDLTPTELKAAIATWNAQAKDKHRILLTGSKGGGIKFIGFNDRLKDLEASALLDDIRGRIMGIVGVTMNELGDSQDINKSNGFNLSYTFKKRAVEPILDEYVETTTRRLLWDALGWTDLELYYEEIDSRDELLQAQIDDTYVKMGVWSINHVRNRKGLEDIPGGDEEAVFTGSAWIPVAQLRQFSQVQLDALQAEVDLVRLQIRQGEQQAQAQAQAAGAQAQLKDPGLVSLPLVRPAQPPERYTTPDGSGSSTAKFKLPRPQLPKPQAAGPGPGNAPPQKPRGPVQTARNAGVRKEDQQ